MTLGLFYDTETSGLPDWHNPSEGEQQPHLVQLAAILVNLETRTVLGRLETIIRPEGWEIPEDVVEIHGITAEFASEVGISEERAVELFLDFWRIADHRIGHVESFDARIIRIATKRYCDDDTIDAWKEGKENAICTARTAKPLMGVTGRRNPKLSEAYEFFFGVPLEGAHGASEDAQATMDLYFCMQDQEEGL